MGWVDVIPPPCRHDDLPDANEVAKNGAYENSTYECDGCGKIHWLKHITTERVWPEFGTSEYYLQAVSGVRSRPKTRVLDYDKWYWMWTAVEPDELRRQREHRESMDPVIKAQEAAARRAQRKLERKAKWLVAANWALTFETGAIVLHYLVA